MELVTFNFEAIIQVVLITTLMSLSYVVLTNKILNRPDKKGTMLFIAYMVLTHIIMNAIYYDIVNRAILEQITETDYNYLVIFIEYGFYVMHSIVYGIIVARTHRDLPWTQCVSASLLAAYISLNIFTILTASVDMFFLTALGFEGELIRNVSQVIFYALLVVICYGVGRLLRKIRFDSVFASIFSRKTLGIVMTVFLFIVKDFFRNSMRIMYFSGIEVSDVIWYIAFAFTFFIVALLYVLGQFERSHQELLQVETSATIQSHTISVLEKVQMNLRYLRHDMQNLLTSLQVDTNNQVSASYVDDIIKYIGQKTDIVMTHTDTHHGDKPIYRNVVMVLGAAFAVFVFSIHFFQYNEWVIVSAFGILMLFIMGLGALSFYTNRRREMDLRLRLERQNQYLELLENVNDKLIHERNEGLNHLTSINRALKTGSMEQVQKYIDEKFTSLSAPIQDEIKNSYAFCNIKIPELQNLLINKTNRAKLMRKEMHVEVREPIHTLEMDLHDLLRCVGILVDNALESPVGKETSVLMYVYGNDVTLVVSNDCDETLNVRDTLKSSKGAHRGQGLGSYQAITDKYGNVLTRTQIKDGRFTQTLRIEGAL